MKIKRSDIRRLIREALEEAESQKAYKHPLARGVQVIRTGKKLVQAAHWEGPYDDVYETTYDILDQQGNKIGFLEYNSYFGNLDGELYDRYLPELSGYGSKGAGPLGKLQTFFKSKTGRKWLDVSLRHMQKGV